MRHCYNGFKIEIKQRKIGFGIEILPRQSPRRVILKYILLKLDYNFNSLYYSVFPIFQMNPLILGGSLTLYSIFFLILTFHLLIMQATTWVLVPLDTLPNFLWVAETKTVLFRGLLHINAARVFGEVH